MDISAVLVACSLHTEDDAVVRSIADVQSRGMVVVDVEPESFVREEAAPEPGVAPEGLRAEVVRILGVGGEPVFGVLPVRPAWASELGKTLEELFDPCTAVAIATAKFSEFDYGCRKRGAPRSYSRRACSLAAFGTMLGLPALGRAVLADLTLPSSPDAELNDVLGSIATADRVTAPSSSGLFFSVKPLTSASVWEEPAPYPALVTERAR